ncbi:MAG TPA: SufD family Fe-S cluster assembly protein [Acidimicrobiales bacterium]|nr:SufD family Fe-S cluster assembly protein [Acidimicrobiales bacterium]
MQARRAAAVERAGAAELPTTEQEEWRYSRIGELDLDAWLPAVGLDQQPAGVPDDLLPVLDAVGERAALVVVRNGHVTHVEVDDALAAKGLVVGRLIELDADGTALGQTTGDASGMLDLLNDAFCADPVLVRVPDGMVVRAPIVIAQWLDADGVATFPRVVVQAGADTEVSVYDHQGSTDVAALTVPVVELDAGPAARLRYTNAQRLGPRVWQLGRQSSRAGRDATLRSTVVSLGGDYARLAIDSTMDGKGCTGELMAVYFGEGSQMHDFRTMQDHVAPATTSNLLFKGAVQGTSRSVYTGLIHIGKQAAGVRAFQTNRNVKLSEGSWAESVPNLEIENNDVQCSHASAVGPVDEEQRFYLESRGVPPEPAERLIVLGFFEEVLVGIPLPGAVDLLRQEIAAKLSRRELVTHGA